MLKTRINFKKVNKIYKNCSRCHTSYNNFLNNLRSDDVVLFFPPSLSNFTFKRLTFSKIQTYLNSIVHQINLINHDFMGVYLHVEWVLGRLINDSILYRIYQNATDAVFKKYSGKDFYNKICDKNLSKKQFNEILKIFIKSGGNLGSGMSNKYLSLTSCADPIITAGLIRINSKVYPTIKAFFGSRSKPAVYGNLEQITKTVHKKSLSDLFLELCIKGEPVKIMDVYTYSAARLTPTLIVPLNEFFSIYSSPCISRAMACFYETLDSISEKTPLINKQLSEISNLCNNFNIPIPRKSFFLFFKDLFNNCYEI